MSYPNVDTATTAPGTATGPYALTPSMIEAIRHGGEETTRVVALSWALAGYRNTDIGETVSGWVLRQARMYEKYIRNGCP